MDDKELIVYLSKKVAELEKAQMCIRDRVWIAILGNKLNILLISVSKLKGSTLDRIS